MKKFILSAFALLLTLAAIIPAEANLGYVGENPTIRTTEGTTTSRLGHRGENPTTNQNWKNQQQKRYEQRKKWQQQHQGTRANQGSTVRNIVY